MAATISVRVSDKEKLIWDSLPKGKRSKIIKKHGLKATEEKIKSTFKYKK